MSVDFERLSSNLIDLIDILLTNQNLCNYVGYNGNNPSVQNVDKKDIAPKGVKERFFTLPFDVEYREDVRSQVHVYYPSLEFGNNGYVASVTVVFDIIVHKDIWLLVDDGKKYIRAYQILKHIHDTLNKVNIGNLGKIHFDHVQHTVVNDKFEGLRLVAGFTEF